MREGLKARARPVVTVPLMLRVTAAAALGLGTPLMDAPRAAPLRGTVLRESFRTPSIGEEVRYELYLPPGRAQGDGLPSLLFLPGYRDGSTYARKKKFFRIAEEMIASGRIAPMAIVCCDRGHGYWTDAPGPRAAYETAIVRDLLERLSAVHHLARSGKLRGALGISFGGFAALKMSFHHPGLFRSVSALSPAIDPGYEAKARGGRSPWHPADTGTKSGLPPGFDLESFLREDPFYLARSSGPSGTDYYLSCGRKDRHRLAAPTAEMIELLRQRRIPVQGGVEDGGHDARFWRRIFPDALAFHDRSFREPGDAHEHGPGAP